MTPQHALPNPSRAAATPPRQRGQNSQRHRTQPLTDDQYLATSLALVAEHTLRKICRTGFKPS